MRRHNWVIIGIGLLVLLLVVAFRVWTETNPSETRSPVEWDSARSVQRALRYSVGPQIPPRLAWMFERGIEPRRIAGQVRIDDRPAAGIEVSLRSEPMMWAEQATPTVRSDAAGRFDFGVWPATQYAVVAGGDVYELVTEAVDLVNPLTDSEAVEIQLRVCQRRGFGTVGSLYGEDVEGAVLSVMARIQPGQQLSILSKAFGAGNRFELCLRDDRTDIRITAPRFADALLVDEDNERMPSGGWVVELLPAGSIAGTYVDSAGQGIAGGRIRLYRAGGARHHNPYIFDTLSGEDGSFQFTALPPGKYQFAVDHFDYLMPPWAEWPTVTLAPGEEVAGVTLVGGECRGLAGTLVDESGEPIVGAKLGNSRTQADGSFVMPCVEFAPFELVASHYELLNPMIPAGREDLLDLVLRVATPTSLSGRVLDGSKGLAGVEVKLEWGPPNTFQPSRMRTTSDETGHYRFAPVPPRTYRLSAATDTLASVATSLIMADASEVKDIVLAQKTSVHATVRTADDTFISGVVLRFRNEGIRTLEARATEGLLDLTVAAPAHYQVFLDKGLAPADGSSWPEFDAVPGAKVELDLRIAGKAHALAGQVVYDDGSPVAFASVSVSPPGRELQADASGHFSFSSLPGASFELYAKDVIGLRKSQTLVPALAVTDDIEIVIKRGAALRGSVVGGDANCQIQLGVSDRRHTKGTSFHFRDLKPGDFSVEARCGRKVAVVQVSVRPGAEKEIVLEVAAGRTLRGIAKHFPQGRPIADMRCVAGMAEASTNEAGTFEIIDASPGIEQVVCFGGGKSFVTAGTSVVPSTQDVTGLVIWSMERTGLSMPQESLSDVLGAKLSEQQGSLVFTELVEDGASARAGIQVGDRVSRLANTALTANETNVASMWLSTRAAGERIAMEIQRDNRTLAIDLQL